MRAVSVTCSHCGATLAVDDGAEGATCGYCGTRSLVERKKAPPPPPPKASARPEPRPAAPNAAGRRAVTLALVPLFVSGVAAYVTIHRTRGVMFIEQPKLPSTTTATMSWNGAGPPLLVDVDGDGSEDAIGLVRYVSSGDQMRLAAFSGRTGVRLWEGASLGTYERLVSAQTALSGKRVLLADPGGSLLAYDAPSGNPLWSTALGERVDTLCAGDKEGEVLVVTSDRRAQRIDLKDGRASGVTSPPKAAQGKGVTAPNCSRLPSDRWDVYRERGASKPEVKGMSVSRVLPAAELRVLVGRRSPGTSVPMLAAVDANDKVRWKTDIPSGNPLDAKASEPELVTVAGDSAFVVYESRGSSPPLLSAFALATGARRWETPVRKGTTIVLRGVAAGAERVFVSSWGHLQIFDRKTGEPLFVVGRL